MPRFFWAVVAPACALALYLELRYTARCIPAYVPGDERLFLSRVACLCRPEPLEQARYLLAITLVPAVLWVGALCAYRFPRLLRATFWDGRCSRGAGAAFQWLLTAFLVAMVVYQEVELRPYLRALDPTGPLLALALAALAWRLAPVAYRSALTRFASGRPWLPVAVAVLWTGYELLSALYREDQPLAVDHFWFHLPFQIGEFAAVLNGRTPHVDFYPQYQFCLGYLLAPLFRLVGLSVPTFTAAMAALSACCLLVFFWVFRLATGGPWKALALYLPFLFVALTRLRQTPELFHQRIHTFNYFSVGPLRYLGPCLTLACLAAFLLRPTWPRRLLLFGVAVLAALNNLDFGLPALGAALLAVLLASDDGPLPSLPTLGRTALGLALGGGLALFGYALLVYVRAGRLPDFATGLFFLRTFAVNGFCMLPMPPFGLHWVFYLTFMAAVARGLCDRGAGRLRRGLLLYAGVFGSGAFMYFVGRSHQDVLATLFVVWAFPFLLLTWTCWEDVRARLSARGWRAVLSPLPLLLTAGYLICVTKVQERPRLVGQVSRVLGVSFEEAGDCPRVLRSHARQRRSLARWIREHAEPGEKVVVIHHYGFPAALEAGVVNVFPFTQHDSLILQGQLDLLLRVMEQNHVRRLFGYVDAELIPRLTAAGYRRLPAPDEFAMWVKEENSPQRAQRAQRKKIE